MATSPNWCGMRWQLPATLWAEFRDSRRCIGVYKGAENDGPNGETSRRDGEAVEADVGEMSELAVASSELDV